MDDAIQNGMWKHSYKMGRKGHIKSSYVKKALSQIKIKVKSPFFSKLWFTKMRDQF